MIREAREAQGISGEAVSCAVGRNHRYCHQLENQKSWPRPRDLLQIADYLKIDRTLIYVAYCADRDEWFRNSLSNYQGDFKRPFDDL